MLCASRSCPEPPRTPYKQTVPGSDPKNCPGDGLEENVQKQWPLHRFVHASGFVPVAPVQNPPGLRINRPCPGPIQRIVRGMVWRNDNVQKQWPLHRFVHASGRRENRTEPFASAQLLRTFLRLSS